MEMEVVEERVEDAPDKQPQLALYDVINVKELLLNVTVMLRNEKSVK